MVRTDASLNKRLVELTILVYTVKKCLYMRDQNCIEKENSEAPVSKTWRRANLEELFPTG